MGSCYSHATYSIIHHARVEAEALGVPNGLSTKHLLLALLHDGRNKAVRTLSSLGADIQRIREEVEVQAHLQDEMPLPIMPDEEARQALEQLRIARQDTGTFPNREAYRAASREYYRERQRLHRTGEHTPPARRAVDAAFQHLRSLGDADRVEPHHLLLALIHEEGGLAGRVVAGLNLSFTHVYEALKHVE